MEFSNKNAVDRAKFGSKLSEGQNKERDLCSVGLSMRSKAPGVPEKPVSGGGAV